MCRPSGATVIHGLIRGRARRTDNSSVPPLGGAEAEPAGQDQAPRSAPGQLGRVGGGRALTADTDEVMQAKPARCHFCQHAFTDVDQTLDAR